jgi:hypothetical protein
MLALDPIRWLLVGCCFSIICPAAEPLFKENGVIALLGGEDMVVADEMGYLESLLHLAYPHHHLKVRCLAWEGDTVFAQPRDFNYPAIDTQLAEIDAAVVILQAGQSEALDPAIAIAEFTTAAHRHLEHLSANGRRRLVVIGPTPFDLTQAPRLNALEMKRAAMDDALKNLAAAHGAVFVSLPSNGLQPALWRDRLHWSASGHRFQATLVAQSFGLQPMNERASDSRFETLRAAVMAKNRLWDRYRRPQNWAFLAGDRVTQPSSRDHLNPDKRWFPDEMKEFLPLIAAADAKVWSLAKEVAK